VSHRLEGQAAVVIGGTKGIGAAVVRRFTEEGCDVVFAGRTVSDGDALMAETEANPGTAQFVAADAGDVSQIEGVVEEAVSRFGKLTVLVNNTAATGEMTGIGPTWETSIEAWESYVSHGLTGAVFAPVKYAIPHMRDVGGGSIVNINSAAALRGYLTNAPYVAVKGAQAALTRFWALELHTFNIRVNALALAFIDTGTKMIEGIKSNAELLAAYDEPHLLGLGKPDDVAYAALWLAAEESRWVTGTVIPIDGGATSIAAQIKLRDPRILELRREIFSAG